MKRTYEIPQRIYLVIDPVWGSMSVNYNRNDTNNIEYTRTDAFIEKACQFIKEHHHEFSFWNTKEYELEFSTQKFIEDFKKYMEK